ncbi:MAG: hypothetical protein K9H49_11210 [Bacteroidales bacterium]|nr:hypothetical protein [Bacteroidales bacterium]
MRAIIKNSIHFLIISLSLYLSGSASLAQVWNREVIDSTGIDMGVYCALALDHEGEPHIAYMDADFYDLANGIYFLKLQLNEKPVSSIKVFVNKN